MRGERRPLSRGVQLALFATAMAWAGAASGIAGRAAQGIAVRFHLGSSESLLESVFLLFLVVVGFRALERLALTGRGRSEVLALPRRAGWRSEWGTGAAIGWGVCLAAALPVLVTGHLHSRLAQGPWGEGAVAIATAVLTLGFATLAQEEIFRGYPFRRLMEATGPSWAAVLLSLGFGVMLLTANPPRHLGMALLDGTLFGLLLAMAYLRTHALWMGWGVHFAYRAVAALVLGLPIAGRGEFASFANTYATGPGWLSGGAFGLDAALLTSVVMLGGLAVLYRSTREYAWRYTHPEIVAGGYEVSVAPPEAHLAMEKAAGAGPGLVQILPSTPQSRSRMDAVDVNSVGDLLPPR